nr:MAG TPA: hypothetical protein [Caudoviricetes sp.]
MPDSTKCHDQDTLIEGLGCTGHVTSCLVLGVQHAE